MNNPELLLIGCRFYGDHGDSDAVHIKDGKIVDIGKSDQLRLVVGDVEMMDIHGSLVLPGLGDAHVHMAFGGKSLEIINVGGLNLSKLSEKLRSENDPFGPEWMVAFNWDRSLVALDTKILDKIVKDRPIIIHAKDLHSCCCNSLALNKAEITADTKDPHDGTIEHYTDGTPNGNLFEGASDLITALISSPTDEMWRNYILKAQNYILSLGVTAVGEVLPPDAERIYWMLDAENKLILEIDGWRRIEVWNGKPPPKDGNRFRVRTLKIFLDGAFGSRTASLHEPYSDALDRDGLQFYSDDVLYQRLLPAVEAGWRLAIHALGDKALTQAIKVLERLPYNPLLGPHRIEHAQLLTEGGVEELLKSRAVISIQPIHLLDDRRWLPARLGTYRCQRAFVWRSIIEAGGTVAIGTDWPVIDPNPLLNIHTAINRCGFNEKPDSHFAEEEALSPEQAINSATHGWAKAAGMVETRGLIKLGQTADFTVVSGVQDDLQDWSDTKVDMTICKGKIVFNSVDN